MLQRFNSWGQIWRYRGEAVKWELSGKSIDKRAIPQWDKSNTSRIMNESTREVMAGIRWGIQEMGHVLREQGLLQEKQSKVLKNLASSFQRTAELLEMINTRESKNQEVLDKQKADKLLAEQKSGCGPAESPEGSNRKGSGCPGGGRQKASIPSSKYSS